MTVYFAQARDGGPIKIGHTGSPVAFRMSQLGSWIPQGVEVIATIAGDRAREESLKWLTKPYALVGEWRRSCVDIWSLIIEATDTGDLAWLPHSTGAQACIDLSELYSSRTEACRHLNISETMLAEALRDHKQRLPAPAIGKLSMERAFREGRVPSRFKNPANSEVLARVA